MSKGCLSNVPENKFEILSYVISKTGSDINTTITKITANPIYNLDIGGLYLDTLIIL